MNEDVYHKLGIGLDPSEKITMRSANNGRSECLGCIHGLEVNFHGVKFTTSVYVVKGEHMFQMILGKPFEIQAKAKVDHQDDGRVTTTLTGDDGRLFQFTFEALPKERQRVNTVNMIRSCSCLDSGLNNEEEYVALKGDNKYFKDKGRKNFKNFQNPGRSTITVKGRKIPEPGRKKRHKKVAQKVKPVEKGELLSFIENHDELDQLGLKEAVTDELFLKSMDRRNKPPVITDEIVEVMCSSPMLNDMERIALKKIIWKYPYAFAIDDDSKGCLNPNIMPRVRILVTPHKAWKRKTPMYVGKELLEKTKFLREKLDSGVLERARNSPYSNNWFVLRKKNKQLRFIQDVQPLNGVTIVDRGQPPHGEKMSESFAGCSVYSTMDVYSAYDEILIHPGSRPLTAMNTPAGWVQMTRLPQGWTNSVSFAQRGITNALSDMYPDPVHIYVDDIAIKGSKIKDETLDENGVRQYIKLHLEDIERVLQRLDKANLTVNAFKTIFCVAEINVLGYICASFGRRMDPEKVAKVKDWPTPRSVTDVRSFLGFAKFYRIFIKNFATICAPLNNLTRHDVDFEWTDEAEESFNLLKTKFCEDPILVPCFDFKKPLIVSSDASGFACGGVLEFVDDEGLRRVIRYESRTFNKQEKLYGIARKECLGLKHNLKVFRPYLFDSEFTVEIDSKVLYHWLTSAEAPDATVARWIAYIRSYTFNVVLVPSEKNRADGLSRIVWCNEVELNDIDIENIFADDLDGYWRAMLHYLIHGELIKDFGLATNRKIIDKAEDYVVLSEQLFRKPNSIYSFPRRVIINKQIRENLISESHDGVFGGHKGRNSMIQKLCSRFYWPGMVKEIIDYVKTCTECQKHGKVRYNEELLVRYPPSVWETVHIDVVHMPKGQGKFKFYIDARCNLSGFVFAEGLVSKDSKSVGKFLLNLITLYGIPKKIVSDNGEIRAEEVVTILKKIGIFVNFTSTYHPQSNGVVERGHRNLGNSLVAWLGDKRKGLWPKYLKFAVWADNTTVRASTGFTPYELMFGRANLLPYDLEYNSFLFMDWQTIKNREDLLKARMSQLSFYFEAQDEARKMIYENRIKGKNFHDRVKRKHPEKIKENDLVLVFEEVFEVQSHGRKFTPRYRGPYRVIQVNDNGTYKLTELDGSEIAKVFHGNRLKKFYSRSVGDNQIHWGENVTENDEEVLKMRYNNNLNNKEFIFRSMAQSAYTTVIKN